AHLTDKDRNMAMIAPLVTQAASQSMMRTLGTAAGPVGLVASVVLPVVLPRMARALGPWGMIAFAIGSYVTVRAIKRYEERKAAADETTLAAPTLEGRVLDRRAA
ncbi:MAG: hypothetical protein ACK4MX_10845, partial [Thermaurantiacus sp.]